MQLSWKLLLASALLSVALAASNDSSCETCRQAVAEATVEWAAMQPEILKDVPPMLCHGALVDVCTATVRAAIETVGSLVNSTRPEAVCRALDLCGASGAVVLQ